ncbi:MAG TPA: RNA polymerase sigma factor [Kofleriaceae bacterium]
MDDDPGEHVPAAEETAALAVPRTITAELEGPQPPPDDPSPPAPPGGGSSDPPAPSGGDDGEPPRDPNKLAAIERALLQVPLHLSKLRELAIRLCATTTEADDLVQNTAERAFKAGMPLDIKEPLFWLTTMMHRLFIDHCRAAKRRRFEPLEDLHGAALHDNVTRFPIPEPQPVWEHISLDDIRRALQELTPPFREVFELHEFEGWRYEQIAKRMQISTVTVGTRLSRVRRRLREILTRKGG